MRGDLRSEMRRDPLTTAASDSASSGALTLVCSALSVLAVLMMTRLLPPEAYAALGGIVALAQTAHTVLASWPLMALVRFGRLEMLESREARASFWAATALSAAGLAVGAVALAIFRHPLQRYAGSTSLLLLAGAYTVSLAVSGLLLHRLHAIGAFRLAALLPGIDRVLLIAMLTGLGALGMGKASAAAAAIVTASLIVSMIALICSSPGLPRTNLACLGEVARFSAPIALAVLAGPLFLWADFWVASRFLSPVPLGCYYLAVQAAAWILNLAVLINVVGGPLAVGLVASGQHERLRLLCSRGALQLSFAASSGLALVASTAPLLLPRFFPEAYADALPPLVLLAAACAWSPVYFLGIAIFSAHRRPQLITAFTLLLGASNLILSLVLVPRAGATGAALGKGLALAVTATLAALAAGRLTGTRLPRSLGLALAPAPLAAALVLLLPARLGPTVAGASSLLSIAFGLRYGRILLPDDLRRLETVGFPRWLRSMLALTLRVAS
jgi:O-antigen/teichoic acid export membrane protein